MTLTAGDFQRIGQYMVNLAGLMVALGHNSAADSTIYVEPPAGDGLGVFVLDMFISTIPGHQVSVDLARERVHKFVEEHGVLDVIADAVSR